MRIIFDHEVTEVWSIDATPAWNPQEGSNENNPGIYSIGVFEPTQSGAEYRYIGEYKLDGTPETYAAARENFRQVMKQAGEKGYFYINQLENFELY